MVPRNTWYILSVSSPERTGLQFQRGEVLHITVKKKEYNFINNYNFNNATTIATPPSSTPLSSSTTTNNNNNITTTNTIHSIT